MKFLPSFDDDLEEIIKDGKTSVLFYFSLLEDYQRTR